jgi:hypothetical protein
MKTLIMIILLWILVACILAQVTGCVSVEYHRTDTTEDLKVTTFLKSLDGLYSNRDETGFEIIIDKTYSQNPLEGIEDLLEAWKELQTMGLRYDPDWRSPLLPQE